MTYRGNLNLNKIGYIFPYKSFWEVSSHLNKMDLLSQDILMEKVIRQLLERCGFFIPLLYIYRFHNEIYIKIFFFKLQTFFNYMAKQNIKKLAYKFRKKKLKVFRMRTFLQRTKKTLFLNLIKLNFVYQKFFFNRIQKYHIFKKNFKVPYKTLKKKSVIYSLKINKKNFNYLLKKQKYSISFFSNKKIYKNKHKNLNSILYKKYKTILSYLKRKKRKLYFKKKKFKKSYYKNKKLYFKTKKHIALIKKSKFLLSNMFFILSLIKKIKNYKILNTTLVFKNKELFRRLVLIYYYIFKHLKFKNIALKYFNKLNSILIKNHLYNNKNLNNLTTFLSTKLIQNDIHYKINSSNFLLNLYIKKYIKLYYIYFLFLKYRNKINIKLINNNFIYKFKKLYYMLFFCTKYINKIIFKNKIIYFYLYLIKKNKINSKTMFEFLLSKYFGMSKIRLQFIKLNPLLKYKYIVQYSTYILYYISNLEKKFITKYFKKYSKSSLYHLFYNFKYLNKLFISRKVVKKIYNLFLLLQLKKNIYFYIHKRKKIKSFYNTLKLSSYRNEMYYKDIIKIFYFLCFNSQISLYLLARYIAFQFKILNRTKQKRFLIFLKRFCEYMETNHWFSSNFAIRIIVKGRIGGQPRKKKFIIQTKYLLANTVLNEINSEHFQAHSRYGTYGINILFKSMNLRNYYSLNSILKYT